MKVKFYLLIFLLYFTFTQCAEESPVSTDDCVRIGAVCNDGTTSSATGSGACSSHGGVDHWICE